MDDGSSGCGEEKSREERFRAGTATGVGITVKKVIRFWQKRFLTRSFYGSPLSPTLLGPDMRVQREGYGRPNLSNKYFQLFSIFIV